MDYLNMNEQKVVPVVFSMNVLLADYHMYYQKLRTYHWNVLGENFFDLHEKFELLYNDARIKIDEIAERILTLKYHPISKFSEYIQISSIEEANPLTTDREMVADLLKDQATILKQMKEIIDQANQAGDEGTIDLMGGFIRELEKESWMLNAWSKSKNKKLKPSMVKS